MTRPLNSWQLLFHFFVRRMLPATLAELLQFHPVRRRLPILGRRVIALFAITALQRNDLSGHCSLPLFCVARALGPALFAPKRLWSQAAQRGLKCPRHNSNY